MKTNKTKSEKGTGKKFVAKDGKEFFNEHPYSEYETQLDRDRCEKLIDQWKEEHHLTTVKSCITCKYFQYIKRYIEREEESFYCKNMLRNISVDSDMESIIDVFYPHHICGDGKDSCCDLYEKKINLKNL